MTGEQMMRIVRISGMIRAVYWGWILLDSFCRNGWEDSFNF